MVWLFQLHPLRSDIKWWCCVIMVGMRMTINVKHNLVVNFQQWVKEKSQLSLGSRSTAIHEYSFLWEVQRSSVASTYWMVTNALSTTTYQFKEDDFLSSGRNNVYFIKVNNRSPSIVPHSTCTVQYDVQYVHKYREHMEICHAPCGYGV